MQTKKQSALEVFLNYLTGFIIAYLVYDWLVLPAVWLRDSPFLVTCLFTLVSIIRTYAWRRYFNAKLFEKIIK